MANLEEMRHSAPKRDEGLSRESKASLSVIVTGMVVGFIAQAAVLLVVGATWTAGVDYRIQALETIDKSRENHEGRITILEQRYAFIEGSLKRQEDLLEKLVDRFNNGTRQ